jgi:alpha-L-fucosidase
VPVEILPLPTPAQLSWHARELYAFVHWGINTFTGKEWGYGDESPDLFDPSDFDADEIVGQLAANGMNAVILTAKHHDGFCLWPTATTEHSVRSSRWRDGQGDVVREFSEAAARHGIGFGVYLSPWDRNSAHYGAPQYVDIYREQLRELLTGYGPIVEIWHDGANGGDGYYGGAREVRNIDKNDYYGWPTTWAMIRDLQPGAVIFSDAGPDIRWVGNEDGIAGDPCWATDDPIGEDGGAASPGNIDATHSPEGSSGGTRWMPAECDVTIRPGWFWHADEDAGSKDGPYLLDLYFKSVGRGAGLNLNVPPDTRGRLSARDVAALEDFARLRRPLAEVDYAVMDAKNTDSGIRLTLDAPVVFNTIAIREDIRFGQRVRAASVSVRQGDEWTTIATVQSIGNRRLIRLPDNVEAEEIRLTVDSAVRDARLLSLSVHLL